MPILSGVKTIAAHFKSALYILLGIIVLIPVTVRAESLYIFISMSMPDMSLKQWVEQANQVDAPLLLRGLVNDSMEKTIEALAPLTPLSPTIQIDPARFELFGIDKVPAIVLSDGDTFDVIYGDQSLQSALWQIEMKGQLQHEAKRLRSKLKRSI